MNTVDILLSHGTDIHISTTSGKSLFYNADVDVNLQNAKGEMQYIWNISQENPSAGLNFLSPSESLRSK